MTGTWLPPGGVTWVWRCDPGYTQVLQEGLERRASSVCLYLLPPEPHRMRQWSKQQPEAVKNVFCSKDSEENSRRLLCLCYSFPDREQMRGLSCWLNTNVCPIVKIWLSWLHHRLCLDWQSSECALGTTWVRSSRYCENEDPVFRSWLTDPAYLRWNPRIQILNISQGFFVVAVVVWFGLVWFHLGFWGFESWRESKNKWLK